MAVAIANASLLGVGYLMLGRRLLWLLTTLVTAGLLVLLIAVTKSGWLELAVLLWWAAMIWHGWCLARPGEVVRRQRVVTLAWVLPLLLVVGLVRFDAMRIEWTVDDARAAGDCAKAKPALDKVWPGHRVVDAPMTARTDMTVEACRRLDEAKGQLTRALAGGVPSLSEAFTKLDSVLAELPGHEKMVDTVLEGFLGRLPVENPCHTSAITDWLKDRKTTGNGLDRAADVAPRLGPTALITCGERQMGLTAYREAKDRYQRLLDAYPDHELKGKAEEGVKQATLAMELEHVRRMGQGYCAAPAQYSGAAPYGKGVNRAVVFGGSEYTEKLPGDWKTTKFDEAVLVVCTGEPEHGPVQESCPYLWEDSRQSTNVAFHRVSIPVRAYELRTGKLVFDQKVTIGGASCPATLRAPDTGAGPPKDWFVEPSEADMRRAFAPAIAP